VQFTLGIGDDEALLKNERGQDTDGERAATEAEEIDIRVVLVIVVAADKFVGVEDIPLEPVAERPA
jgi:hypothetical protein